MHGGEPADDDVILDDDMPGECAIVGKDAVVPHDAIVCDVDVTEKIVVIADDRLVTR